MATVLLGAGAAVDAHLPTALQMTRALLDSDDLVAQRRHLTAVYGGLLMQAAADPWPGGTFGTLASPRFDVGAEDLLTAIDALADIGSLPVAPFVTGWNSLVVRPNEDIGKRVRALSAALDKARIQANQPGARLDLEALARAVIRSQQVGDPPYAAVRTAVFRAIGNMLRTDPRVAHYLTPLLVVGEREYTVMASLNYDLLVEQAADTAGLACNASPDPPDIPSEAVRLIKLHGSIDWGYPAFQNKGPVEVIPAGQPNPRPAFIFGGRNKLTAEGPYLDLLFEWRTELEYEDHLVVVGYSFSDAHINETIRRWLHRDPERRMLSLNTALDKREVQRTLGLVGDLDATDWSIDEALEARGTRVLGPCRLEFVHGTAADLIPHVPDLLRPLPWPED